MSTNPIIIVALIDFGMYLLDLLFKRPTQPTGEPDPDQSKPMRSWAVLEELYQYADVEVQQAIDEARAGREDRASDWLLALTGPAGDVIVAVGAAVAGAVAMPEPAARRVLAALREAHEAGELA